MSSEERLFIASSQFPSGVGWLLNCLLELDVLVFRRSLGRTWVFHPASRTYSLHPEETVLRQWIPALSARTQFQARDPRYVEWWHDLPHVGNTRWKTILLVRDGRDAVYSQHRRDTRHASLNEMLQAPVGPLGLPPAETWALHAFLWSRCIPPPRLHVVRFEDLKSRPHSEVERLLTFLRIARNSDEVDHAIVSSGVERARAAEEAYRRTGARTEFAVVNRRGVPGEWREAFTERDLDNFLGFPATVLRAFGYDAGRRATGPVADLDFPADSAWGRSVRENWLQRYETAVGAIADPLPALLNEVLDRVVVRPSPVLGLLEQAAGAHGHRRLRAALCDLATEPSVQSDMDLVRRLGLLFGRAGCLLRMRSMLRRTDGDGWCRIAWQRGIAPALTVAAAPATWKTRARRVVGPYRGTSTLRALAASLDMLGRWRRALRRLVRPPRAPVREDGRVLLHLGCGGKHAPGWTNIDIAGLSHVHFRQDVRKLSTFQDRTVDVIYACHVLEHLPFGEVPGVLREWLRVLKSGGLLRISVPDFEQILAIYRHEGSIAAILPPLMGGQRSVEDFHNSVFDEPFLRDLLMQAGFERIERFDPETPPTDVFSDWATLPVTTSADRSYPISLNLAAIAPDGPRVSE